MGGAGARSSMILTRPGTCCHFREPSRLALLARLMVTQPLQPWGMWIGTTRRRGCRQSRSSAPAEEGLEGGGRRGVAALEGFQAGVGDRRLLHDRAVAQLQTRARRVERSLRHFTPGHRRNSRKNGWITRNRPREASGWSRWELSILVVSLAIDGTRWGRLLLHDRRLRFSPAWPG